MVTYFVNKEKGVVVAVLGNGKEPVRNGWESALCNRLKKISDATNTEINIKAIVQKVLKDRKLVGISRVHPDDTFNEIEGRRLARADLLRRYAFAEEQAKKEYLNYYKNCIYKIQSYIGG